MEREQNETAEQADKTHKLEIARNEIRLTAKKLKGFAMADLHRIYQGRITGVDRLPIARRTEKNSMEGEQLPPSQAEKLLWQAHSLFQDAVNYYLLAIAALVDDTHNPLGGMRRQIREECWTPFVRKGKKLRGMRASVAPHLGLDPATADFDEVCASILSGNDASERFSEIAALLLGKIGGDSAIQQGGRTYFPRLCWSGYTGTRWDATPSAHDNAAGESRIAAFVHADKPPLKEEIENEANAFSISWLIAVQEGVFFEGTDAENRIQEAIDHFARYPDPDGRIGLWIKDDANKAAASLENMAKKKAALPSEKLKIPRNRKAAPDRTFAAILFKVFPSEFTRKLLSLVVAKPKDKESSKTSSNKKLKAEAFRRWLAKLPDDPIRLARGQRGFVFPAFTALPSWGGASLGKPCWKEFDIAAFKEALKTINQIRLKQEERAAELEKVQAGLDYLANRITAEEYQKALGRTEEDEDQHLSGVLAGDPRVDMLERLLNETLAISNELTDGESMAYALRGRTLRGYRELTEKWNTHLDKHADAEPINLIDICDKFQTQHKDDIGSVPFFRALANREFWPIWRTPTDSESSVRRTHGWSENLVRDYAQKLEWIEEVERLKQPIRLTPADPTGSPRFLMLSDIDGIHDKVGSTVIASLPCLGNTIWGPDKYRLHYSAPRLLRDRMAGGDEAVWTPPVLDGLGIPDPTRQDFKKTAIQLMPRRSSDGRTAMLLNLPVVLDVQALQEQTGSPLGKEQFNGTRDKNLHLHWPETGGAKADWWTRPVPFSVLTVDLGQRDAGAGAILRIQPGKPSKGHSWQLGHAGAHDWFATLAATRLLRLPGEDATVLVKGEWKTEPYGERGRLAGAGETEKAVRILSDLGHNDPADKNPSALSFPAQNDLLLFAARREQAHLARLHRWLWFLTDPDKMPKALEEISESGEEPLQHLASANDLPGLSNALRSILNERQQKLPAILLSITDRILPLRGRKWEWVPHSDRPVCHVLCQTEHGTDRPDKRLRGQRGISMERIEQLERLRQRWQALNRIQMRKPGSKPLSGREMRHDPVPDPCPDILDKLERIKDDRIDQLAHLILVEALGVRLRTHTVDPKERSARNLHGEYERFRDPVAAVVLEDLSRYLSSQGRAPRENTRLMQWCHRAVLAKTKMLCEPYGIPVLETGAAYSSRFCSFTGAAGFRAVEVTLADKGDFRWRRLLDDLQDNKPSEEARHAKDLFAMLEEARRVPSKKPRSLVAPQAGGPLFIPMSDWPNGKPGIQQADINAAINLGLRAMAGPTAFDIRQSLRVELRDGSWRLCAVNKLEKARSKLLKHSVQTPMPGTTTRNRATLFIDLKKVAGFEHAAWNVLRLATGKGLWGSVKQQEWQRAMEINGRRIRAWKLKSDGQDSVL